jgi:hypothetical protein
MSTKLVAADSKAIYRPSELREGLLLEASPNSPEEEHETGSSTLSPFEGVPHEEADTRIEPMAMITMIRNDNPPALVPWQE